MDTDTCADVSHALDPILDEADPIEQSYYLEVGSPGLGRKLTRPETTKPFGARRSASGCTGPTRTVLRSFPAS